MSNSDSRDSTAIDRVGLDIPKNITTVKDARTNKLTIYNADHTEAWITSNCYLPRSECR